LFWTRVSARVAACSTTYLMEEEGMLKRLSPRNGTQTGRAHRGRRRAAAAAAAGILTVGSMVATAVPAEAASTNYASVYSDQWMNGYRGWVSGGVVMLCWADGAWSNGTNRWFAIYAGSISGFVNANLVSNQRSVGHC
jgi:hypothetical protein